MGIARLLEAGVGLRSKDKENPGRPPSPAVLVAAVTPWENHPHALAPQGPVGVVCPYSQLHCPGPWGH